MLSSRSKSSWKTTERNETSLPIQSSTAVASYEEAFDQAGFGLYQYFLLLQCGWANASDAIEIMSISFIIPSVRDAMHVSHAALSALTMVLFLGMIAGGYLWGSLADTYGRRNIVCISLAVNAVFAALSAFSRTYWLMLILRLISGIGVGGSLPVVFSYFSEFQPTNYRGGMISALATCWMAGNLLVAGLAWAVLPVSNGFSIISPYGEPWRIFVIFCTIPCLTSAFFFWLMPESPKYLYKRGRLTEALEVLKIVHKWNHRKPNSSPLLVKRLLPDSTENMNGEFESADDESEELLGSSNTGHSDGMNAWSQKNLVQYCSYKRLRLAFQNLKSQLSLVYSSQNNRKCSSIALTAIYILVAFGGYGMSMWMPVLMEKTEKFGGSPCRGHVGNQSHGPQERDDSANIYLDVFIGAAAQLPGNVLTVLVMDRVGAKPFLIFSAGSSAIGAFGFWIADTRVQVLAMNCLFNGVTTVVWNSLDVITVEMFPTGIRSTAAGHLNAISRLGSICGTTIFGLFMDLNCGVPILTVFVAYALSCLLSIRLPKTRSIVLQ